MFNPKDHAKELLSLYQRYRAERPHSIADQQGLECARELVRLMESDIPDEAAIEALHHKLDQPPVGAGSAWIDLRLTANALKKDDA
jgi:hypothetical protein